MRPTSRLRASVEVRNQVSHPLRLDSGRNSNRNRHLSPSVNASRLQGTNVLEARFVASLRIADKTRQNCEDLPHW
jgi:hypothetical protein